MDDRIDGNISHSMSSPIGTITSNSVGFGLSKGYVNYGISGGYSNTIPIATFKPKEWLEKVLNIR